VRFLKANFFSRLHCSVKVLSFKTARPLTSQFGSASLVTSSDTKLHIALTEIEKFEFIGTVVIAAVIAGASFWQDRVNNADNDQWQASLLSEVKASKQHRSALEDEAKKLKRRGAGVEASSF
jgi:hypothetical protein